jgi:hypothetical protein
VRKPQPVEGEAKDRVRTALGAGDLVVLGGDGDHLADRRLEGPRGRTQDHRRAADDLDRVVVDVLVRHE